MRSAIVAGIVGLGIGVMALASACGSDAADDAAKSTPDGGAPGSTVNIDGGTAATNFDASAPVVVDGHCGYQNLGTPLHVADNIDVCVPKSVCTPENCPPPLADCVNGVCQFKPGYNGLATLGEAWVTEYCGLTSGGCHGVTQVDFPEITASSIGKTLGIPICEQDPTAPNCVGIAASSAMMVGNSQVTNDPATGQPIPQWGLGLTEATGICYELTGPGGKVTVALTDRCGGYCKCGGSDFQECGPCVNAKDLVPNCPCAGTAPSLYTNCCGNNCGVPVVGNCDWCANNNHPHFDLDDGAFEKICAAQKGNGSCKLTSVKPINCIPPKAWPPGGGGGGGGGAACKANSFQCAAAADHQPMVPGTGCCCNFNMNPQPDGSCG